MLSRLAGNCFWMARSLERADHAARLIAAAQEICLRDVEPGEQVALWARVCRGLGVAQLLPSPAPAASVSTAVPAIAQEQQTGDVLVATTDLAQDALAHAVRTGFLDRDHPSSAVGALRLLRENARSARHLLTAELWEPANAAWLEARDLGEGAIARRGLADCLAFVRQRCQLIRGALVELPGRELRGIVAVGVGLERIDGSLRLIAEWLPWLLAAGAPALGSPAHSAWEGFLAAAGIAEETRRNAPPEVDPGRVVAYLLADPATPRSLIAAMGRVQEGIVALSGRRVGPAQEAAADCAAALAATTATELISPRGPGAAAQLIALANAVSSTVQREHFV